MKKSTLIFGLLFSLVSETFNAQSLNWGYSMSHTSVQNYPTAISSNGSEFVICGGTGNNVNLDFVGQGANFNLQSGAFIAKYNANATIDWLLEYPSGVGVSSQVIGQDGEVYTLGLFSGTVDFDYTSSTANYTSSFADFYVQKLDQNGNFVWLAQAPCDANMYKIAKKSNGNIVVAGRAQQEFTTTLSDNSTHTIPMGIVLYEINSAGSVIGVYSIPTPNSFSTSMSLEIDQNDNIYLGFPVDGQVDVDCKSGVINDQSNSAYDAVIVKYNSSFDYQWHKLYGDIPEGQPGGWDFVNALETDENGNLYSAGYYTWTTDFDPDENPGVHVYEASTSSPAPNGYIIKYNSNGEIIWIHSTQKTSLSGSKDCYVEDLVLVDGKVVITGELNGSADFDGGTSNFNIATLDGGLGLFFAVYSVDGTFINGGLIDGLAANDYHVGAEALGGGFVMTGTFQKNFDIDPTSDEVLLSTDENGPFYNADNDIFVVHYALSETNSLKEHSNVNSLSVYPNPSVDGKFNIKSNSVEPYFIYNSLGEMLIASSKNQQIDLGLFTPGIYFLKQNENVVKIVVQ